MCEAPAGHAFLICACQFLLQSDLSTSPNLRFMPRRMEVRVLGNQVHKHRCPPGHTPSVLGGDQVRAVTTGRQHSLAGQTQPPPPQLPPPFPLTRFKHHRMSRGHQKLGRSKLGKERPRSSLARPCSPARSLFHRAEGEPRPLTGGDQRSLLLFGQDQGVLRLCLGLLQPPCLGVDSSVARGPAHVHQESPSH